MTDATLETDPCRIDELPQLGDLLDSVFITERGAEPGHLFDFAPLLYDEQNIEQLRVVRMDGVLVGHAGICIRPIRWRGQVLRAGFIGGVCSRGDLRGMGIGSVVMRDAARHMEDLDLDFGVLWTGSPYFYERLGWCTVGGLSRVIVPALARPLPADTEVMKLEASGFDLEDCHALHVATARNEVIRTLEETRIVTHQRDVRVAIRGGELVGYAIASGNTARELDGDAEACIALLTDAARAQDAIAIMPLRDTRVDAIVQTLGANQLTGPLGMCLIVNREQLLGKIEAELGRAREELGMTADMEDEAVMRILFGDHEDQWSGDLPLDIFIDYADHV